MSDAEYSKEKKLFKLKKGGIAMFLITLFGGLGMLAYGLTNGLVLYLSDGQAIAITSPIFLAAYFVAKKKLKNLGV